MPALSASAVISDVGREYLRYHLAPEVGPIRLRRLIEHFGSVRALADLSRAELRVVEGVGPKVAESVFQARENGAVDAEVDRAVAAGVRILCAEDAEYPRALLHTPDPPTCLYIRGRIEPTDAVAISIVGTRRCSHYGLDQALRFGEALGAAGFTVVSGLARGIDGYAHQGALRSGGRTIAVLGNGLPEISPPEHAELAVRIAERGAVVSELPVGSAPDAKNFPGRNRIIAGMSLGVLVVEAGGRSGALITAQLAVEYNREVFAIPGRIDMPERTAGVNRLIRDGEAKLVTCLEDLLAELGPVGSVMAPSEPAPAAEGDAESPGAEGDGAKRARRGEPSREERLTREERAVLVAVREECEDIESICAVTKLSVATVSSTLIGLQLKGYVRQVPGGRYVPRGD